MLFVSLPSIVIVVPEIRSPWSLFGRHQRIQLNKTFPSQLTKTTRFHQGVATVKDRTKLEIFMYLNFRKSNLRLLKHPCIACFNQCTNINIYLLTAKVFYMTEHFLYVSDHVTV